MLFPKPDEKFIRENFKDPEMAEVVIAEAKKRLKITQAIALFFLMPIAGMLGYSFLQQAKAIESEKEAITQEAILKKIEVTAFEDARMAQEEREKLETEFERIKSELSDCTTKKTKR